MFDITGHDPTLLQWDKWSIVGSKSDSNPGVPMYGLVGTGTAPTALDITALCYTTHYSTFVSFISYSLPYYDFSPKGELIIFDATKSNVTNAFM